jgi:hypothetical protein
VLEHWLRHPDPSAFFDPPPDRDGDPARSHHSNETVA